MDVKGVGVRDESGARFMWQRERGRYLSQPKRLIELMLDEGGGYDYILQ